MLLVSGGNDVIADNVRHHLNAMTWVGRIALLILPPIAYVLTYRICLGLQQHDREVLEHGVETGIIKRLPNGEFIEVHQPLAAGRTSTVTARWSTPGSVPKKMNRIGALKPPRRGFFRPVEEKPEIAEKLAEVEESEETSDAAERRDKIAVELEEVEAERRHQLTD